MNKLLCVGINIDQLRNNFFGDLKMHQPTIPITIVTLKEIMVNGDYCYTLKLGKKTYRP